MEEKHEKFIVSMKGVTGGLGIRPSINCPPPMFGRNYFTATFQLRGKMENISTGFLNYRFRNKLDDRHLSDDYMYIDFLTKKVRFSHLMEVVHKYIEDFNAYAFTIYPEDLIFTEYFANMPFERKSRLNLRKDIELFSHFSTWTKFWSKMFLNAIHWTFVLNLKIICLMWSYLLRGCFSRPLTIMLQLTSH